MRVKKAFDYFRRNGFCAFIRKVCSKLPNSYHREFLKGRISEEKLQFQRSHQFSFHPMISILMPVYNPPLKYLKEAIDSVFLQSYKNWQLCIADGSTDPQVRVYLKELAKSDSRISLKTLSENYGISENTNQALRIAKGEFTALFDHDDLLEKDALFEIVNVLQDPEVDAVYTDEDKYSTRINRFVEPHHKPDYSPEYLYSCNYITHFYTVRTSLLKSTGAFRSEYDGSQDYDVILKTTYSSRKVGHIPKVLYHWRIHAGSTAEKPENKMYCYNHALSLLQNHFNKLQINYTVSMLDHHFGIYRIHGKPNRDTVLSVLIYDTGEKFSKALSNLKKIDTLLKPLVQPEYLWISESEEGCNKLREEIVNLRFIRKNQGEGASSGYQSAAKQAKGNVLLFLTDSMYPTDQSNFETQICLLENPEIGAVGSKTVWKKTVFHSVLARNNNNMIVDTFRGIGIVEDGYQFRAVCMNNVSAVSLFGMVIRREDFTNLVINTECDDIDLIAWKLCHKLLNQRKRVVFFPDSVWALTHRTCLK